MSIFQAVGMLYLMFVSFHQPGVTQPMWVADFWIRYVPFIHVSVVALIFIVIPLIVITTSLLNADAINSAFFQGAYWINCFTSITVAFIWFPL